MLRQKGLRAAFKDGYSDTMCAIAQNTYMKNILTEYESTVSPCKCCFSHSKKCTIAVSKRNKEKKRSKTEKVHAFQDSCLKQS